jgi:hypothetical protein
MNRSFLDVLVRQRVPEDVNSAKRLSQELNALCEQLAAFLSALERPVRSELLNRVLERVLASLERIDSEASELLAHPKKPHPQQKPAPVELTPDLLEWARRQFSEEELVAGIRDIRENGGVQFAEIIKQLKSGKLPQ